MRAHARQPGFKHCRLIGMANAVSGKEYDKLAIAGGSTQAENAKRRQHNTANNSYDNHDYCHDMQAIILHGGIKLGFAFTYVN